MADLDMRLTLFPPNSAGEAILLADSVIGGPCTTLVAANKGAEVVNLGAGTTPVTVIPTREGDIRCDIPARWRCW